MAFEPGHVLGAYTIRSLVGAGGMGEVYRAHDARLDRLVAIKVLRQELTDDAGKARFFREARMVARLRHPNVVAVFDVGERGGLPFLVMELVDGPSLAVLIRERRLVTLDTRLQYIIDVCDGLAHAHERGIVHRDVKPANVLVDEGRARLADFGVAWEEGRSITSVGGSPNYFAPEQLAGLGDHRSDLFSLGATFYELLTGAKAFPGSIADGVLYRIMHDPAPALPLDLGGAGLAEVVSRALEKDPAARFQSAAEFKAAAARVLGTGQPVAGVVTGRTADAAESDVVRFRRRLLESAAPAEIRRLKYEVDQYLAGQPYDVDGRMLSDEIDRALLLSPVAVPAPRAASAGSWGRPAALVSTIAVAFIAVSTLVMMRDRVPETSSRLQDPAPPMSAVPAPGSVELDPVSGGAGSSVGKLTPAPSPQPPAGLQDTSRGRAGRPTAPPVPSGVEPPSPAAPSPSPSGAPPREPPPPPPTKPALEVPLPTRTPSASDADAIRELIARYESAHVRRDAASVAAVHPGVDVRVLADTFDQYRALRFSVLIRTITVSSDASEAVVEAVIDQTVESTTGPSRSTRSPVNFRLGKEQGRWVIREVRTLSPASAQ